MSLNKNGKISLRIDTEANWYTNDPILNNGEIAISTLDVSGTIYYKMKVGNGSLSWSAIEKEQTFLSQQALEEYGELLVSNNNRNPEKIIHPYNGGVIDPDADFTCSSNTDNTAELNAYIATLASDAYIVFGKGNYIIKSTVAFGNRKATFDYGAVFTCYYDAAIVSGSTPFVSITNGVLSGCNFVYSGTANIYQPCINASGTTGVIENCNLTNFVRLFTGTATVKGCRFEHATDIFSMSVSSGSLVLNNNFISTGNRGLINVSGASKILYNNVGQVSLTDSAGAVSAFNVVNVATTITNGNKVNDFVFGA